MKASEYIGKLQVLVDKHGDHECVDSYNRPIGEPEFNEEDSPCFVLADDAEGGV